MLENPLLKLKAQRILQKEFEKQMRKAERKRKKHKKSKSSSSSADEETHSKRRHRIDKKIERRHSSEEGREEREFSEGSYDGHHHKDSFSTGFLNIFFNFLSQNLFDRLNFISFC